MPNTPGAADVPSPPLFVAPPTPDYLQALNERRQWLMHACDGPIVLVAPKHGPNQQYPWAHCYQPVYQDSYFLYLTGINQTGIAMVLDPATSTQHIFLPEYNPKHAFWEGDRFSVNCPSSHAWLAALGFDAIHPMQSFKSFLNAMGHARPWHLQLASGKKGGQKNEAFYLKQQLSRMFRSSFECASISELSWRQRLSHHPIDIAAITMGAEKTGKAFLNAIRAPFTSETELCGQLVGELLKQTPYGLAFSPIVAANAHGAILHYTQNSGPIQPGELVLLDFGLRWQGMCTDVSRTIPAGGRFSDLQQRLMGIVLTAQLATIAQVKAGVTVQELNEFAWRTLDAELHQSFLRKGGTMNRPYKIQPHNIGHLLGFQVHDGDANRGYNTQPLPENSIITIEPGLYGEFEWQGEVIHCGIRIEDNLLVQPHGAINLTQAIPKSCQAIEAAMAAMG
ncbi:MAG: aminopeptidase P N-terminal domain-containing protein [Candidatus Margulisbacteria bacterium]|nr:aminopeptidase P N-terminal domain-containing protein [Candidatus Margulisiibacteriota bacterium]